jgi:hypothetical protein
MCVLKVLGRVGGYGGAWRLSLSLLTLKPDVATGVSHRVDSPPGTTWNLLPLSRHALPVLNPAAGVVVLTETSTTERTTYISPSHRHLLRQEQRAQVIDCPILLFDAALPFYTPPRPQASHSCFNFSARDRSLLRSTMARGFPAQARRS